MPPHPHLLAEATWPRVTEAPVEVAILPWGATEAHNTHLPYGTDTFQASAVAAEAARLAGERGVRVIVLPAVPFGVQTGQLDIPLCLNMNPSTQAALLGDLARSLEGQGIRRLVVVNGHGGNDFRPMIRELQPRVGILLCTLDWYRAVDPAPFFDLPGDHAGELETSVMQHLHPELVLPLEEAGKGHARPHRVAAFREGWAWAPRRWSAVTRDTGVGDPRGATAQKGERYFGAVTERIAGFLVELAAVEPGEEYEGEL